MAVVSNLTSSLVKGDSTSAKKKFRFKAFIGVSLVDGDSTIQLICKNIYLQTQIMELKMMLAHVITFEQEDKFQNSSFLYLSDQGMTT